MIFWSILNLLIGAVLGAILGMLFPKWIDSYQESKRKSTLQKRRQLLENERLKSNWVIKYYEKNGNLTDLYNCKIGNYEMRIPFITKDEWNRNFIIPPYKDHLLKFSETSGQNFPVDIKLIEKRKKLGQELFNEPTLYIDRIEHDENHIKFHVKECEYFQVATSIIRLEEETFKAISNNRFKHIPIRNSFIPGASQVQTIPTKPISIGCSIALAIKVRDSFEILIHTRSHSTICFGGAKTVIPNFGFAPIYGGAKKFVSNSKINGQTGKSSEFNLLYYNFIKEYLEELFNYEELIKFINNRKANPFWFYELPEAKTLIKLIKEEKFTLEYLGFGFEALNGIAMISLLGIINDEEFSASFKRDIELNWEVSKEKMIDIDFANIKSNHFENWFRNNDFVASGAFTISRALKRLRDVI